MPGERNTLEREILGAILYKPNRFIGQRRYVDVQNFADPFIRKIISACHQCADAKIEVSHTNIFSMGKLSPAERSALLEVKEVSGDLYLLSRKLAEFVMLEEQRNLSLRLQTEDADPFENQDLIRETDARCSALVVPFSRPSKADQCTGYIEALEQNAKRGVRRIPTGFWTLDRMTSGGLALGNTTLIGGMPGSGKTSFMLQLALHAAQNGTRVAFIEGEMPAPEIYERLDGIASRNEIDEIRSGKHMDASVAFVSELYKLPFDLIPLSERTISALLSTVRQAAAEGTELVCIDYLQVFVPKGRQEDEFSKVKLLSEQIRQISLQHQIHVCVASSLNRSEADGRKSLNSFYGSSQLGHDCSIAMLLAGEQRDTEELTNPIRSVELDIVKNRSGCRGSIHLDYHLRTQRFSEVVSRIEPRYAAAEIA